MNVLNRFAKDISLRTQLTVVFSLLTVVIIILGINSSSSLNSLATDYSELSTVHNPIVETIKDVQLAGTRIISSTFELVLDYSLDVAGLGHDEETSETHNHISESVKEYTEKIALYRQLAQTYDQDHLVLVDGIDEIGVQLVEIASAVDELIDAGAPLEDVAELHEEFETLELSFLSTTNMSLEAEATELAELDNHVTTLIEETTVIIFIVSATIVFGAILTYVYISRLMLKSVDGLKSTADAMRQGDLDARTELVSSNEIGQLGQTLNFMADAVQSREQELKTVNASLEQRVAVRTAELEQARDEALVAQRIAKENDRLKSEFLSTMSHELRTPLNAIEGFTSIMLSGMGIELSDRAEDMVKRVSSNSKRLLHLINDFLDLSRIESGRLELVEAPLSPADLARKWQNEVGVLAEEKGVDFIINVSENLPTTIFSDEEALSKIAINLLGNAFKFTHQGQVTLNMQRIGESWSISVSDTGIGIPPHAREYIFDEFRQVDGSSKRVYGGTGLGLALVQKLARAMGGNVSLESEVDKGSTFTVILPLITYQEKGAVA